MNECFIMFGIDRNENVFLKKLVRLGAEVFLFKYFFSFKTQEFSSLDYSIDDHLHSYG